MALLQPFRSNEMFGAHFSMYGALAFNFRYTWGSSLINLILSAVPRVLWPDRPLGIYEYYAEGVGAAPGTGFAIHHATGWYLNFGVPGVIIGALLFGWLWATCCNRLYYRRGYGTFGRVFTAIAPSTLVAGIPGFVRAGPEAYKGLVLVSFLVPTLVLGMACIHPVWWRSRSNVHRARVGRRSRSRQATDFCHP